MSRRKITAAATAVTVPVFIQDTSSTTGAGLGSLVFNSAGLAAKYRREGQATWTTITLATATAGTWTSGGFISDGGPVTGGYEIGIPNAVLAAGARWAEVALYGATNMLAVLLEFELDTINYQATNGFLPADVQSWLGVAVEADAGGLPNVNAKRIGGQTLSVTGAVTIGAFVGNATHAITVDSSGGVVAATVQDKTGYSLGVAPPTAAQVATQLWTDLLSGSDFSTAASIGKLLKDNIDAAVSSRSTYAGGAVASVTGTVGGISGVTFPATVASPTNITAGTLTTVTNLTNAPTAGDFTATMKTSLNAATPAVTVSDKTGFALTTTEQANIADTAFRRTMTHVQASAVGDAISKNSLYGFIQMAQRSSDSGGILTILNADGTTLGTLTLTTTPGANPVTGIA